MSLLGIYRTGAALAVLLALIVAAPASAAQDGAGASAKKGKNGKKAKKRGWRTLRGKGRFSVKAPPRYRLKIDSGGYRIIGPAGKMTLLAVRTGGQTRTVAEALLGGALPPTPDADRFGLTLKLKNGDRGEIYFSRTPAGVAVTLLEPGKKKRGKKGGKRKRRGRRASASAAVGNSQRNLFARIARSARNVGTVNLPMTTSQEQEPEISLKPFTTADGSAKAMVPDAPGWVASGAQGIVEGGHPEQGSYAFGVLGGFFKPGSCLFPPNCPGIYLPFMSVRPALEQAWPLWIQQTGANVANLQIVSEVPGSTELLGPGYSSGMFQVRFTSNGKPGSAFVIAGTTHFGGSEWYLYYSYIAAYDGVPGTVGDALLRTWQSWDPSVDQERRQRQTIITQQETMAIIQSSNEYRRRVYEKTNYEWNAYIRGDGAVLGPVAKGVVGEGGVTLVEGPGGKLFDFEGNQFKKPGE